MTRDEALMLYRPIRAAIRRILSAAVPVCNQADLTRAAKQLGLWAEGKIFLPEGDKAAEMLSDIALFEANERGRRAFDHFLSDKARQFDATDFELAQRSNWGRFPGKPRWCQAGAGRMRLARGGIVCPAIPKRAPM